MTIIVSFLSHIPDIEKKKKMYGKKKCTTHFTRSTWLCTYAMSVSEFMFVKVTS